MNLADIWNGLITATPGKGEGLLRRRLFPEGPIELFAAVRKPANLKSLQLRSQIALPAGHVLPECKGLILAAHVDSAGYTVLDIAPAAALYDDIYLVLASALAARLEHIAGEEEAVRTLIGELERWQRFLEAVGPDGLGKEAQQGLFGELHFLRDHLLSVSTPEVAVTGWTAPGRGVHDFEFPGIVCEVKSISSKAHHRMRIPSEKQLDGTQGRTLVYCMLIASGLAHGTSLPSIVGDLRRRLAPSPMAADRFEDCLLRWGYLDLHAPRYRNVLYAVNEDMFFDVRDGFPRITSADLPPGVGDVTYSLAIGACQAFRLTNAEAQQLLTVGPPT